MTAWIMTTALGPWSDGLEGFLTSIPLLHPSQMQDPQVFVALRYVSGGSEGGVFLKSVFSAGLEDLGEEKVSRENEGTKNTS